MLINRKILCSSYYLFAIKQYSKEQLYNILWLF